MTLETEAMEAEIVEETEVTSKKDRVKKICKGIAIGAGTVLGAVLVAGVTSAIFGDHEDIEQEAYTDTFEVETEEISEEN